MEKAWRMYTKRADFKAIAKKFNIDQVVARVIVNRDMTKDEDIEKYLYGSLNMTYDPFLMKDMDKGTDIILNKINQGKKIRIIGDYDVDGIMSTYILYDGLKRAGADISYEIPDRLNDGYGINERIIKACVKDGIDTIITCDNGISAVPAIKLAKEEGLTVVVTDHHPEKEEKVNADAVIDINQKDCEYPFKEICGTTVAYKFIKALFSKMNISINNDEYVEYVALATVCDVMSLTDESRIYVREGLRKMKQTDNIGLRALIKATALEDKEITGYALGFILGPCFNAAGRLESAKRGLELLFCNNVENAALEADNLVEINEKRKEMTIESVSQGEKIVERDNLNRFNVMVVYIPGIHESLAGLVAGRLKDKYYKPVIVLTDSENEDILKGSARSIDGYNIALELQKCDGYLEKYGGHPLAAGLSLRRENLDLFIKTINENESMTEDVLAPKLFIDVPMPAWYIHEDLVNQLSSLGPFGKGNKKPVFAEAGFKIGSARILGKNQNVLKLVLKDKENRSFEAIYFNPEEFINNIKEWFTEEECDKMLSGLVSKVCLDIAYEPTINEYMGNKSIQLRILAYKKNTEE